MLLSYDLTVQEVESLKADMSKKGQLKASGASGEQSVNAQEQVFLLKNQNESLAAKL